MLIRTPLLSCNLPTVGNAALFGLLPRYRSFPSFSLSQASSEVTVCSCVLPKQVYNTVTVSFTRGLYLYSLNFIHFWLSHLLLGLFSVGTGVMATAGGIARRAVKKACESLQQHGRSHSTLTAQSISQGQNRVVDASLTVVRERARLRGEQVRAIGGAVATSCLLGVPLGHNSSFLQGPAFSPPRIREAIWCGSTNSTTESGKDLEDVRVMTDAGDIPIQEMRDCGVDDERLMKTISEAVKLVMDEHPLRPLVLGGDHSISYPVVRAVSEKLGGQVDILHFDAHPDIYHAFEGNIYSHASGFARIMEGGHARRLLQVGLRSINKEGREQGKKFGVEQYEMRNFSRDREFLENLKLGEGVKGVYVSIDVDCLDPAFAPGVSHIEPGGLSFRDVMNILQNLHGDIVGGDVVEFNPQRDTVDGMTAMVAAKLVRELTAKMSK